MMALLIAVSASFILLMLSPVFSTTDNCPAMPPCTCGSSSTIYCSSLGLTTFPQFKPMAGLWDLHIFNNSLTSIPSNAVRNIKLEMFLAFDNEIESVADDAFEGQGDSLIVIHLYNNRLIELPKALVTLHKLMALYIYDNPILVLNQDILSNLSNSLSGIAIGSPDLTSLPSLNYMSSLFSLDLYSLSMKSLPENLFQGIQENILYFSIRSSSVESIPLSINRLRNLQDFTLVNNSRLTSPGLPAGAFKGLFKLRSLTIIDCAINALPPVFHELTNLYMISLSAIPMSSIASDTFANASNLLWYIRLNDTQLSEIPQALSEVSTFRRLELTFSKVSEIRSEDFANLTKLETLNLFNNPITTVSPQAFSGLNSLGFIDMANTMLTTIPQAIKNLPKLFFVNLLDTPIACSCESLGWIKQWKDQPDNLQILGNCFGNMTMSLMTYIYKELPKCP